MVGILSAEDPDQGQTMSFTVADSSYFSVKDNQLVVNGDLDFETSPSTKVEVTATDNGLPLKSVRFVFKLLNMSTISEIINDQDQFILYF